MRTGALRRVPPAGDPVDRAERAAALAEPDPERSLRAGLRGWLGAEQVDLFASGRAALRALLAWLAARSGRREVVIPAYCCFSVPAAAVAAGLRVRLVDVDACGRIDAAQLAALPLGDVAALVVANLFGIPEPIRALRAIAEPAGVVLVDDAAQALGGEDPEGRAGARGDVGLLSFGRGKPLSGLGGGALAWARRPEGFSAPAAPRPARRSAQLRALAWDAALHPAIFRWLAVLPGLHVGETRFDPHFETGAIGPAALVLAAARLPRFARLAEERARRAESLAAAIRAGSRFLPLVAPDAVRGVYPRLAVLAPDAERRAVALRRLTACGLGASAFYPSALGDVAALRPHLAGPPRQPGAEALARRMLTLPTHSGADAALCAAITRALAES
jgi:dTDP-4-amino-4,6-dideoxygalactose transaminase